MRITWCLFCVFLAGCAATSVQSPTEVENQYVLASEDQRFPSAESITAIHPSFCKTNGLETRLLESDGSATVCMNPVYLFVVVTNNFSGPDLIMKKWVVPIRVSRVKKVTPLDGQGLRVEALREDKYDIEDAKQSLTKKCIFDLRYDFGDGRLGGQLEVVRYKSDTKH